MSEKTEGKQGDTEKIVAEEMVTWIEESSYEFDPMKFYSELSNKHPKEFKLMEVSGIHPISSDRPLINLYTGEEITDDSFENIGVHCIAVAIAVGEIAEELSRRKVIKSKGVEEVMGNALIEDVGKTFELMRERAMRGGVGLGIFNKEKVDKIEKSALEHDVDKSLEIMRRRAAKEGKIDFEGVYSERAYQEVANALISIGVDEKIAKSVKDAGKETGHNSLSRFVELDENGQPRLRQGDWKRKIVHLADDMAASTIPSVDEPAKTVYLTPLERMEYQRFRDRYDFMFKEGFGFNQDGDVVKVADINKNPEGLTHLNSYYSWQDWVSRQMCKEIKDIIDPNSLEAPEYWMKRFISDRVSAKLQSL